MNKTMTKVREEIHERIEAVADLVEAEEFLKLATDHDIRMFRSNLGDAIHEYQPRDMDAPTRVADAINARAKGGQQVPMEGIGMSSSTKEEVGSG